MLRSSATSDIRQSPPPAPGSAAPDIATAIRVAVVESPTDIPTLTSQPLLTPAPTLRLSNTPTAIWTFTHSPQTTHSPPSPLPNTNTLSPINTSAPALVPSNTLSAPRTSPPPQTATSSPTFTPGPTAAPSATSYHPTLRPTLAGLSLDNVRAESGDDELLIFGNIVNNTGLAQEITGVSGVFFDAQGQIIADDIDLSDYWSSDVLPNGGRTPFQLSVSGITSAASHNLSVETQPSTEPPRTDFQFLSIKQTNQQNDYCVSADLKNNGNDLSDYLIIAAVLYDGQNKVVNFSDWIEPAPAGIVGEDTYSFEICVSPPNAGVARYELVAWGR